jgi:prepilin peptidase CpaA
MTSLFSHYASSEIGVSSLGVILLNTVLLLVLAICGYTDATKEKIYNKVVFPAMLAGMLLHLIFGGRMALAWSAVGLVVGFAIQFLAFALNLAKAGDVKLLMAVGALKGWYFCVFGFLYGAVAFSIIAIPTLWRKGELREVGDIVKGYVQVAVTTQGAPDAPAPVTKKKYVPWGVGLCVGFFIALVLEIILKRASWL